MTAFRTDGLLPKTWHDGRAFAAVVVLVPATFLYETSFVLPSLFGESREQLIHLGVGIFLLVNVVGNFFGLWLVDTSTRVLSKPLAADETEGSCDVCVAPRPRRAWHCAECNCCQIKRDHHCIFAGTCVGYRNYRYFFLFMFYIWASVIYCTYFNILVLIERFRVEPISVWAIIKLMFPFFSMATLDMSAFFFTMHVFAFAMCSYLLYFHSCLLWRGQTTFENASNNRTYDLGWRRNLEVAFGANWPLSLLWPFAISKLPHDGTAWELAVNARQKTE